MDTQKMNEKSISPAKKALRKKGGNYLLVAIACIAASIILFSIGVDGGIIWTLINLAFLVFLILAIVTLLRGYIGK